MGLGSLLDWAGEAKSMITGIFWNRAVLLSTNILTSKSTLTHYSLLLDYIIMISLGHRIIAVIYAKYKRRQWHPTPVLLPWKSHGQRSLVGCGPWGTKSWTQLSNFPFTFHFDALEKEMATHSSVLAWRIPGTGEPGGLPSMWSHRVGHDWSDLAAAAAAEYIFIRMGHLQPGYPWQYHYLWIGKRCSVGPKISRWFFWGLSHIFH